MFPARPKRLKNFVYVGKIPYFLTICTFGRQRAFDDVAFARTAIDQLLRSAAKFNFAVYAYCFMPDHVHVVLLGERDDSDFLAFIKSWNTQTGYAWRRGHTSRLWQDGYYEHILRSDVSIYCAARYVVMNPVRAGIVDEPGKYPFSGSTVCPVAELVRR